MLSLLLSEVAQMTRGKLHGADVRISAVSTDTRSLSSGALFVALTGERFDAHDFVGAAKTAGAAAALVTRNLPIGLPQIVVADAELALGDIARAVRAHTQARVIGITGSNGKTTVKTLLASILALHGRTHVNAGNFNNEIGLPLSLLAMPTDTQFAVLEMGAGKPGDIAYLAAIARPEIGLVNNIAPAHLERMGTVHGIAETKGALYAALPMDGVAVINADDTFAALFTKLATPRRIVTFALDAVADVSGNVRSLVGNAVFELRTPAGRAEIRLPLAGRHNVVNALAASALAFALGVPLVAIKQGLENAPPVKGRLIPHAMPGDWTLIDDSYNANPASVAAAIALLAQQSGEAWLVLGDMRELGTTAESLHAQVAGIARAAGIARLFTTGTLSRATSAAFGPGATHYADHAALAEAIRAQIHAGVTVLVKGSRSSAMERVVHALIDETSGADDEQGEARNAA